jgi:two-component system chemotaxis sensor kinase CheA
MSQDDSLSKQLLETFKAEVESLLLEITNNLLELEQCKSSNHRYVELLKELFRAAHNIKGSARAVEAVNVGEIAHHMETLFAAIQNKLIKISPKLINICLHCVDYMNEAMRCFSEQIPLSFDLTNRLQLLKDYTERPEYEVAIDEAPFVSSEETKNSMERSGKSKGYESIRITLQSLDKISANLEELQPVRIAIEEHYATLNKFNVKLDYFVQAWKKNSLILKRFFSDEEESLDNLFSSHRADLLEITTTVHRVQRGLRIPINELAVLLNSLQDEINTVRLVPVESQLHYLPRIVRDLAKELNKTVNFHIQNNAVKIDKMILDGIKDPIIHLIRNALDHGIEDSNTRQLAGKSLQGTISITVSQENHQVVFKISDDGAGINLDELRRIALEKNIIRTNELETMSPEEVLELIFRPGFSTRQVTTGISGRGVGLDVVRSNLIQLKGQVNVSSQLGEGTHFFLRVPITLATERGLIVSCTNQEFIILTHSVERVLLVKKSEVSYREGAPRILIGDQPILLCSLSEILSLNHEVQLKEPMPIVLIKKDSDYVALYVDEVIGEQAFVVKPLQEPLIGIPFVRGATLTGNNQINFVLNSAELIKKALLC